MSFSNMMNLLQQLEKEKIVLVQLGKFYTVIGEDAVYLHLKLNLKCVCFKKEICKVGIPVERIEFHLERLKKLNCSYVVYNIDKARNLLVEKYSNKGNYHNISSKNLNCLLRKGISVYRDNDNYMKILKNTLKSRGRRNE